MSIFRLVTFDITGTILKFKRPVGQAYSEVGSLFGVESDRKIIENNFKKGWVKYNQCYPNFGREHGMDWQDWWKRLVVESFDGAYDEKKSTQDDIDCVADCLLQRYSSDMEWNLDEGCACILTYLKGNGVKIGAISNFDPRLHNILEFFSLNNMFDFVLTSYEAGFMKPDVRIFMMAESIYLNSFGPIDRNQILHVGDSYENDFNGAKIAGWEAALIKPQPSDLALPLSPRRILFRDLRDLTDYIEKISTDNSDDDD